MNAMTSDKDRAEYLMNKVLIPSLKADVREPFYNFLQVLEDDDNPVVKAIVKDLRSHLRPSMPPQPPGPPVQPAYHGHSPHQPMQEYSLYQGQAPPQHLGSLTELGNYLEKCNLKMPESSWLPANNRNVHAVCLIR